MAYWIVYKHNNGKREYVCGTDEFGYPKHTTEKKDAWKFYDFATAMTFFGLKYCITKEYI